MNDNEKYTIEIEVERVDGKARFCASVKECPGLFAEGYDLYSVLNNLADAYESWSRARD